MAAAAAAAVETTPCRFKRVMDKATGRHYYYDPDTRETFWTLPEGLAGDRVSPNTAASDAPRNRRKS